MQTIRIASSIKFVLAAFALTACSASAEHVRSFEGDVSGTLLVGNKGENSLSFIDLKSGRELARRETGANPHEIAISPDGRLAAVVNYGGAAIEIFDVAAHEKIETIDLSPNKRPHGIVWLDDGRIITTTEGSDSLTIVSPPMNEAREREVTAIATGQKGSHMVTVSPDKTRAYVSNMQSGTMSVLDLDKMRKVKDLPAGTEPEGLAITPDGKTVWIADRRGDVIRIFDAATLKEITKLATGKVPIRVAISPDGKTAVTSNYGDGSLSLFDVATQKAVGTVKLGGQQGFGQVTMLFSRNGERLYVAETGVNRVVELDFRNKKTTGRLPAGKNGDGLAIAPTLQSSD